MVVFVVIVISPHCCHLNHQAELVVYRILIYEHKHKYNKYDRHTEYKETAVVSITSQKQVTRSLESSCYLADYSTLVAIRGQLFVCCNIMTTGKFTIDKRRQLALAPLSAWSSSNTLNCIAGASLKPAYFFI